MKKYQKAQMIAKNLPTGSYAAGCPAKDGGGPWIHPLECQRCERAQ